MREASTPALSSMQKEPEEGHEEQRGRERVPSFNGAGREPGCFWCPRVLGKRLSTFANTISLTEVPARAELTLLLLIINNGSTVKRVLRYSVPFSASPRALQRRNRKHV